jgi:hypothetical protein
MTRHDVDLGGAKQFLQAVLQAVLPQAVFKRVKQLDPQNSSTLSRCIYRWFKLFSSCFELFWVSCFVCPPPYRGHAVKHLATVEVATSEKAL